MRASLVVPASGSHSTPTSHAAVHRVPDARHHAIGAVLDIGADGILVPHVLTADSTRAIARAARFAPDGDRSLHNGVRAARYGAEADYFIAANTRTAVLVMCEDAQAVAAIDELVAVPGVDAIFVGPLDLSASMGFVGRPSAPAVQTAIAHVKSVADARRVAFSLMVGTPADARAHLDAGARMVLLSLDTALFLGALRTARDAVFPEHATRPVRVEGY